MGREPLKNKANKSNLAKLNAYVEFEINHENVFNINMSLDIFVVYPNANLSGHLAFYLVILSGESTGLTSFL